MQGHSISKRTKTDELSLRDLARFATRADSVEDALERSSMSQANQKRDGKNLQEGFVLFIGPAPRL